MNDLEAHVTPPRRLRGDLHDAPGLRRTLALHEQVWHARASLTRWLQVTAFRLLLRFVALASGAHVTHLGGFGDRDVPLGLEVRNGLAIGPDVEHYRFVDVFRPFECVSKLGDGARPDHICSQRLRVGCEVDGQRFTGGFFAMEPQGSVLSVTVVCTETVGTDRLGE